MHADELDFRLPPELIAQHAAEPRDSSRLLVCERATGAVRHRRFAELLDELRERRPAGRQPHAGAAGEGARSARPAAPPRCCCSSRTEDGLWLALVRPYRRLREGETVSAGELRLTIHERLGEGRVLVRPQAPRPLDEMLDLVGRMPLPPTSPSRSRTRPATRRCTPTGPARRRRRRPGCTSRPSCGRRRAAATRSRRSPWTSAWTPSGRSPEIVEQHHIHSEHYAVPESSAELIERALAERRRVVAVGTTSVRVLETVFGDPRAPLEGRTRLLITPGHTRVRSRCLHRSARGRAARRRSEDHRSRRSTACG